MDPEQAILIYCLKSLEAIRTSLIQQIPRDLFFDQDNQKLFDSIFYAFKSYGGHLLTEEEFKSILKRSRSVQNPEDQKRLLGLYWALTSQTPPSSPIEFYIKELIEVYTHKTVEASVEAASQLLRKNQAAQALNLLEKSNYQIKNIVKSKSMRGEWYGDNALARYQLVVDKKNNPEKFRGTLSGYPQFDRVTKGFKPGQLIVLAGRAKSGKSIFMVNITRNLLQREKRVLYVAIEGGLDLPTLRMDSVLSGVSYEALQDGSTSPEELAKYHQTMQSIQGTKNFHLWEVPAKVCTSTLIGQKIDELTNLYGTFDLVIVDHVGLMGSDDPEVRKEQDWLKLGSICLDLKNIAGDRRVPIITPIHVNKEASKRKSDYTGEDVGRSLQVVQNVDMIVSWRLQDPENTKMCGAGTVMLGIPETRDSKNKLIELYVDFNQMSIIEKTDQVGLSPVGSTPSV